MGLGLVNGRRLLIVFVGLLVLAGGYIRYYQQSIDRVQSSVQGDHNLQEDTFYKNELTYGDLSRSVRTEIPEEEFDAWSTWKDVDKSFDKLPRPAKGQSDYVFQVPLKSGLALVYYDLDVSGFVLRYVDVR